MTRETKIGLLVGLAFIIVVGILLSDYNRNETPTAALPLVADNVKNSTATLHNGSSQNEVVPPPAPPTPARPVPTRDDLHQQEVRIDIGPAAGGPVTSAAPGSGRHVIQPGGTSGRDDTTPGPIVEVTPVPPVVEGSSIPDTIPYIPGRPQAIPPVTPTVNGAKAYIAVESDTVSKLAGRFLGGNTKANREAIIAMNPSLKANPNNVIVGRTYMIPAQGAVASATPAPQAGLPIHPVTPSPAPTPAPSGSQSYYYTVKENDSLWKIASEQLGDGSAYEVIKEMNRDVLKGGDSVRPNMRLRLPAKPVASAN